MKSYSEEKILGWIIDHKPKFKSHVKSLSKKQSLANDLGFCHVKETTWTILKKKTNFWCNNKIPLQLLSISADVYFRQTTW